jgi:hypothetical protein
LPVFIDARHGAFIEPQQRLNRALIARPWSLNRDLIEA